MTREEAYSILHNGLVNAPSEHDWCMAFEMAIQVLKQEPIYYPPCQDCHTKMNEIVRAYDNVKSLDDAVSRQAVINVINETYGECNAISYTDEIRTLINALPSVLPKRERSDKE